MPDGGLAAEFGLRGIFGLARRRATRKLARARRKAAKAREEQLRFALPFIGIRAEEQIQRRGIQDSSIAPIIRQEAALRTEALRRQIELSRRRRLTEKRLRRLGVAEDISGMLASALAIATMGSGGEAAGETTARTAGGGASAGTSVFLGEPII